LKQWDTSSLSKTNFVNFAKILLPRTRNAEMNVLANVAWKNMSVVAPAVATAAVRANGSEPVTAALNDEAIFVCVFFTLCDTVK
jgi:hypothetical protein